MNVYSIYTKSKSENYDLTVIKQGFSLWALIFNIFWAFYHKMWMVVLLVILVNILIFSFDVSGNMVMLENGKYIIQLFVFGFFASEIREFYAKKNGLKLNDIILANSEEEAELKYLTRNEV